MKHTKLIDELLNELSYRVGIVDIYNKEQQSVMSEILTEWGEFDVKETIFEFLTEKDETFTARKKDTGEVGVFKSKDSRDAAIKAGTHEPIDKKDDEEPKKKDPSKVSAKDFADRPDVVKKKKEKENDKKGFTLSTPTEGESSSQQKKRRDENNKKTDEIIRKNKGDVNKTNDLILKRRKQLDNLIDVPAGGGGSLLGEKSGGDAASAISKNPNLTQEEFIEQQLEKLRGTPLYDKMKSEAGANKKYAKDPEKYIREWLEVGYRTGKNEVEALKKEKKYKFKQPQSEPYPIPVVMDYNQQQIVKSTFEAKLEEAETKCGSGTDEACKEVAHLKQQLEWINKLEDTDSGIIYETEDGYLGFKHTSNKKGWKDPHNNTSINVKGEKIRNIAPTIAKINNLNDTQTEELLENIDTTINEASDIVAGAETVIIDDCKKIEDVDDFVSKNTIIGKYSNFGNARSKDNDYLRAAASKPIVIEKLKEKGIDPENATDEEIFQACIELKREGKTQKVAEVDKLILKVSETIKRIRAYSKQGLTLQQIRQKISNSGDISDEDLQKLVDACNDSSVDILVDTNDIRKETMKVAHEKVVKDIRKHDQKIAEENGEDYYPNPETAKNGPHQQAYIDSFLEDVHYTRYIDGELEGVQSINVGGYDIQPIHFRACLKDLSGFDGDTETPQGKEELKQHLRETLRIKPGEASVTFNGQKDGEDVELGQENYRTKGASKSILAHLGDDIINCLKKKVGA
jgi:hypothetical protein